MNDGPGRATQTATGVDFANNAYVASVVDEEIEMRIIGPALDFEIPIPNSGAARGDPDFSTNYRGTTYLVFSQLDSADSGLGRDIYFTHNNGGSWLPEPVKISVAPVDEFSPRITLDPTGDPHVVWSQTLGNASRVMYLEWSPESGSPGGDPPQGYQPAAVANGDYPHAFVDFHGFVHVVYSRQNDLWYNNNSSGEWNSEKRVTTTPSEPESSASIGGDLNGNILVCYESRNSLYFATKPPDRDFRPPKLIDAGGVLDPRMHVRSRGQVTIVYAKNGDISFVTGISIALEQPRRVTETPEVEGRPSFALDLWGNLHVSFIREGEVYYTNNGTRPEADFSGVPTRGEVPLTVEFGDLSRGDIQRWLWDFGDGATSSEQNPTHTYTVPDKYTVSLKVVSPGVLDSVATKEDYIFVLDPSNVLEIPDQTVAPGQKDVWFPVLGSHEEPIMAFQVMGTYDPNFLRSPRFELSHTVVESLQPEIFEHNDRDTFVEVGCIFQFEEPIDPDKQFLKPGERQTLLQLVFDISESAPPGAETEIQLLNDRALSPVFNIFTIDRITRLPALEGSTIKILEQPFPARFIRGDADGSGLIDITDAIRILGYLFLGGLPPTCLDAADVGDQGRIDISGAITVLGFLFTGGPQPATPFPKAGYDTRPDNLAPCE